MRFFTCNGRSFQPRVYQMSVFNVNARLTDTHHTVEWFRCHLSAFGSFNRANRHNLVGTYSRTAAVANYSYACARFSFRLNLKYFALSIIHEYHCSTVYWFEKRNTFYHKNETLQKEIRHDRALDAHTYKPISISIGHPYILCPRIKFKKKKNSNGRKPSVRADEELIKTSNSQ